MTTAVLFPVGRLIPLVAVLSGCAGHPGTASPPAGAAAPSASVASSPPATQPVSHWHGYPSEDPADAWPEDESLTTLRRNAPFYRDLVETQGRDEPWATELEHRAMSQVWDEMMPGLRLEGIKCARALCAFVFSAPDRDAIGAAAVEVPRLLPPTRGFGCAFDYRMRKKGRSFVTMFVSRDGTPLPMPPIAGHPGPASPATP